MPTQNSPETPPYPPRPAGGGKPGLSGGQGVFALFPRGRRSTAAAARFEGLAPGCRPAGGGWAGAAQPRGRAELRVEPRARGRLRRLLHLRPCWNRPRLGIAIRLRRHSAGMARARVGLFVPPPLPPATRLGRRPVRPAAVSDPVRGLAPTAGPVGASVLG